MIPGKQIDYYEYLKSEPNIINLKRFESNESVLKSTFDYTTERGLLSFEVLIPHDFPQTQILFFCTSISGYEHQGITQLLCLNVPQCRNPEDKLYFELEKLHQWINKFYILDEQDERYEHPLFNNLAKNRDTMIFSEEYQSSTDDRFAEKKGVFKFSRISPDSETFIIKDISGNTVNWSSHYKSISKSYKGMWVITDCIPVVQRKERISKWSDLLDKLPSNFESDLFNIMTQSSSTDFYGNFFYIMLGYFIPYNNSNVIHWDLILLPRDNAILKEIRKGKFSLRNFSDKIIWGFTFNASYSNFIGRGSFTSKLINSNILIIGIGAIGSNLAESLVRGGVKNIAIMDNDLLEPGNETRSFYDFKSVNRRKTDVLFEKLVTISPHVEVAKISQHFSISKGSKYFEVCKNIFNKYDYIFDCTASMDTTCRLDNMELGFKVISFSITDEAKEFVCLTGLDQLAALKEKVFNDLDAVDSQGSFYPEVGCWTPTFKANNTDINVLLNYALAEINYRIDSDMKLNSFVIRKSFDNRCIKLEIDYVKV